DPEDWWRAAEACLARLPGGPVGLSGQMHGLVVLDAEGRVLRPAILWNDQRTAAECTEIEALVGLERLVELTGNRALTGFTAPKLLWLRRHEPDLYGRVRHVLLPKDYVRLRLTGELAVDVADASGTLLFDVRRRAWSEDVCAALEIPLEWLPPAHESTEIAGAGDQAAAALGVGIGRPGPIASVRHDRGALWRGMLEGVAYGLRDSLELLHELGARPVSARVSGGGARSELWLRIVASVLGLPLETTESEEGSAFGAALLAGVRAGVFSDADDAVARCVRVRRRIEPEWDYEHGYRRFRRLYPTLRPLEKP